MSRPWTIEDLKKSPCAALNSHLFATPEKKPAKGPKFKNKKLVVDDIEFDSIKEAHRYGQLKLLRKQGLIGHLEMQKPYLLIESVTEPIIGKKGKPLKKTRTIEQRTEYLADFVYITSAGETIVEDVKSEATRKLSTYIIKRKLMLKVHGITIKEI